MHFSFLALLALSAVTALAAPVPGQPDGLESDPVGKSVADAEEVQSDHDVESLFQCAWRYQHLDEHLRMPNIHKCIEEAKRAKRAKMGPPKETKKVEESSEGVAENPNALMSALIRLPRLSGIRNRVVESIQWPQLRPLGAPSIPAALRPFPI